MIRHWLGPSLIAVVLLAAYQWFVAPSVASVRADLEFLHAARLSQMRAAPAPKP